MPGMLYCIAAKEAGNNKALNFFERDPIEWKPHPFKQLYSTLFHLKAKNQALWNGVDGGQCKRLKTGADEQVFAFSREKKGTKLSLFSISPTSRRASVSMAH